MNYGRPRHQSTVIVPLVLLCSSTPGCTALQKSRLSEETKRNIKYSEAAIARFEQETPALYSRFEIAASAGDFEGFLAWASTVDVADGGGPASCAYFRETTVHAHNGYEYTSARWVRADQSYNYGNRRNPPHLEWSAAKLLDERPSRTCLVEWVQSRVQRANAEAQAQAAETERERTAPSEKHEPVLAAKVRPAGVPTQCWHAEDDSICLAQVEKEFRWCEAHEVNSIYYGASACRGLVRGLVRGCDDPEDAPLFCTTEHRERIARIIVAGTKEFITKCGTKALESTASCDKPFIGLNWIGALLGVESPEYKTVRAKFKGSKAFKKWAAWRKHAGHGLHRFEDVAKERLTFEPTFTGPKAGEPLSVDDQVRQAHEAHDRCHNGCRLTGDPTSYEVTQCMARCSERMKDAIRRARASDAPPDPLHLD